MTHETKHFIYFYLGASLLVAGCRAICNCMFWKPSQVSLTIEFRFLPPFQACTRAARDLAGLPAGRTSPCFAGQVAVLLFKSG